MIYRAIQLIQIFLAGGRTDGRTDERTKVIQEVLADLKKEKNFNALIFKLTDPSPELYLLYAISYNSLRSA